MPGIHLEKDDINMLMGGGTIYIHPLPGWRITADPVPAYISHRDGDPTNNDIPNLEVFHSLLVPENKNDWTDAHWNALRRAKVGMTFEYADGAAYDKYEHQLVRLQMKLDAATSNNVLRAMLKQRFPLIGTDEAVSGSGAVDALLTDWWADLGGEIKPTPEEGEERYACQNCEWTGTEDELAVIDGLYKGRIEVGEPMPPGQCPECGALAQELK